MFCVITHRDHRKCGCSDASCIAVASVSIDERLEHELQTNRRNDKVEKRRERLRHRRKSVFFLWCPQCVQSLKYFTIWDKPLIFTIKCCHVHASSCFRYWQPLHTTIIDHGKMCTMIMWMCAMIRTLSECFQLLNCIESHLIESYWIVCYQHVSFLESYRDHVAKHESYRLLHEGFTPLIYI